MGLDGVRRLSPVPSKGKAVVGQSGGPTVVINQSLVGIVQEAARLGSFDALWGARHGVQGVLSESFVDLTGRSKAELETVARTPCAALGSVRKKPTSEECLQMFEVFRRNDVRAFFYIGGNDSAETAHLVSRAAADAKYEMRVFHVPKTIDNDLLVTDHCPGYGSAARFVALAIQGDNEDNRSLAGIKVDVVMGRNAGFLTAASVLGRRRPEDGPHLVYVPEGDFARERFARDVAEAQKAFGRCLIAVSEGIHGPDGRPIGASDEKDTHGNVQLSGSGALGDLLAGWIRQDVQASAGKKLRVRADTFGYLQRSFPGVISETDAAEAREVGREAVRASALQPSGSIALRRLPGGAYACETFVTPLETVAKKTRSLDRAWIAPAGNHIQESFRDYALPLTDPLPEMGRL